jgi:hypothetical protein
MGRNVFTSHLNVFQGSISTLIQKIKILRPLPQATVSNHPNVFTFTLTISEGRVAEASEPSDNTPPPPYRRIRCLTLIR